MNKIPRSENITVENGAFYTCAKRIFRGEKFQDFYIIGFGSMVCLIVFLWIIRNFEHENKLPICCNFRQFSAMIKQILKGMQVC